MTRGRKKLKKELIATLPQNCFWVHNGPILSDLAELHEALKHEITLEQYEHHVTDEKNDFADWIEGTLSDRACANQVRNAKKQDTAVDRVKMCLKRYKQ